MFVHSILCHSVYQNLIIFCSIYILYSSKCQRDFVEIIKTVVNMAITTEQIRAGIKANKANNNERTKNYHWKIIFI